VSKELSQKILAGVILGLFAMAMDYFVLQHFVRTPVNMAGGLGIGVVLLYLIVPFVILQFGGRKDG
jgi:hypothetical protein